MNPLDELKFCYFHYFYNLKSPKVLINGDVLWKKRTISPVKNILRNWNEEKMDLLLCLIKKKLFFANHNFFNFLLFL